MVVQFTLEKKQDGMAYCAIPISRENGNTNTVKSNQYKMEGSVQFSSLHFLSSRFYNFKRASDQ